MRKILRSRIEKKNRPGNITAQIGVGSIGRPVRKFFVPEDVYVEIEKAAADKYGEEGRKKLFSAGSRMGRRFCESSDFPRIDQVGGFKLKRFFNFFATYVETVFSHNIEYDMNFEEKRLELRFDQMSICRKSGIGEIFSKGVPAGAMSYLYNSDRMTSYHRKCQGMGDKKCHTVVKPHQEREKIQESEPISEHYDDKNKSKLITENRGKSLKEMTKTGDYEFSDGILMTRGKKHMINEICMPFLLEDEFSGKQERDMLFQSSMKAGKELFTDIDHEFIENYFTAIGWGIMNIEDDEIVAEHFPWTYLCSSTEFSIFRGLLSGLMSEAEEGEKELRDFHYNEEENRLKIER